MQPLEPDPRILAAAMSANVLCPLRRVRLERPFTQCPSGVQTFAQVCAGTRLRCGELVVVSNQLRATTAPEGIRQNIRVTACVLNMFEVLKILVGRGEPKGES